MKQKIIEIFKFKSPFFEVKKQNIYINNLINKLWLFFESYWLSYSKETRTNDFYKILTYKCDFDINIKLQLTKKLDFKYIPIFSLSIEILDKNNIDIKNMLEYFLEMFDTINDYDMIIKFYTKEKIKHSLFTVEYLNNKFKKTTNRANTLKNFLIKKEENIKEIKEIFLYFNYIVFELFTVIQNTSNLKNDNHEILTTQANFTLKWHLEMSKERLEHINSINISNFKKYTSLVNEFYNIFENKKM